MRSRKPPSPGKEGAGTRVKEAPKAFPSRGKSQTAVETVMETIKNLLIGRKLGPGDLLPSEGELSETLSFSRGSIREAVKILEAFGVIEIRRGNGTYVATRANPKLLDPLLFSLLVTHPEIEELVELRLLVEKGIVELVVRHADESDIAKLEAVHERMAAAVRRKPPNVEELLSTDIEFHGVLGEITHNVVVANVYRFVIELVSPTMHPGHGLKAHERIVRALRARDSEAAIGAIEEHDEVWHKLNTAAGRDGPAKGYHPSRTGTRRSS